ncbi:DDE Tnp 1-like zinc-ribbon [Popillia japonica]|uniref:RNA-directed DNA polymerase n=1 Tax=Popillia japonica TaxID=7064 RepID=A0AAW1IAY0_POPJA
MIEIWMIENRIGNPKILLKTKLKKGQAVWRRKGKVVVTKWKDKRDVRMISHLLDVALWNSYYLYRKFIDAKCKLLSFREMIIKSLIAVEANKSTGKAAAKSEPNSFHYLEPIPIESQTAVPSKRCQQCSKNNIRKRTRYQCPKCDGSPGPKTAIPTLATARLQRWSLILSSYRDNIKDKPGSEIGNADALSRLPLPEEEVCDVLFYFSPRQNLPLSWMDIANETKKDLVLCQVLDITLHGWKEKHIHKQLTPYFIKRHELSVEESCLLKLLHEEHPGIVMMKALASSLVWWNGIDVNIENMIKQCNICQETQNSKKEEPLHKWPWTTRIFEIVQIDFAEKDDGTYVVTMALSLKTFYQPNLGDLVEILQFLQLQYQVLSFRLLMVLGTLNLPPQGASSNRPKLRNAGENPVVLRLAVLMANINCGKWTSHSR